MRQNKTNNIGMLKAGILLMVLMLFSAPLFAGNSSRTAANGSSSLTAYDQVSAKYIRMEEVRHIYKDEKIGGYLVFMANTPSIIVVTRQTVFESEIGTYVSYEGFDKMAEGRLIKVEASRNDQGQLVADKLTILNRDADNLKKLDDSRKTQVFETKDLIRSQERGEKAGR